MVLTFVPDLPVLAAFAAATIVLNLTPGPDLTFCLSKTIGQSRPAGFAALAGVSLGLVVHTVLVAAGLSVVLAASATAFTVLKIAGAAYLAWLAIDALHHGSSLTLAGQAPAEPLRRIVAKGLLINLLNPKIIIFFLTFLPQFVAAGDAHAAGKMLFLGLTFTLINVPVSSALILAAARVTGWLRGSSVARRAIDWIFAGVLGAFAVRLILAHGR
jgi:threonine/homoserine/homoserine lactone efflux protein